MLQSLFCNNQNKVKCIYLLSTDITNENARIIKEQCNKNNADFVLLNIEEKELELYDKIGPWSKYTFLKLLIPKILPENIDKVLFLDIDMVILDDLTSIYNSFSSIYAVAGVEDIPAATMHKKRCNINSDSVYINSGFMIINVQKWKKVYKLNAFEKFIKNNIGKMDFINDQDVINYTFQNDIMKLPYRYNVTNLAFGIHNTLLKSFRHEWKAGRKNPAVIHFTNSRKPWIPEVCHPYKKEWLKYLNQTPYKSNYSKFIKYDKIWMKNCIKNLISSIIDYFRLL